MDLFDLAHAATEIIARTVDPHRTDAPHPVAVRLTRRVGRHLESTGEVARLRDQPGREARSALGAGLARAMAGDAGFAVAVAHDVGQLRPGAGPGTVEILEGPAALTVSDLSVAGEPDVPAGPGARWSRWPGGPRLSAGRLALILGGAGIVGGGAAVAAATTTTDRAPDSGPVARAAGYWTLDRPARAGEDRVDGMQITIRAGGTYRAALSMTDGRDRAQVKVVCDGNVDDNAGVLMFTPYAASGAGSGCAVFMAARDGDELTITAGLPGLTLHRT